MTTVTPSRRALMAGMTAFAGLGAAGAAPAPRPLTVPPTDELSTQLTAMELTEAS